MASSESRKRKREDDPPRVTFTTPNRTFERLLKESSLESLRTAVIRKLGLDGAASLEFSQLRDGKQIDLEDEDDFEAFESYAASNGVAEVRIKILNLSSLPEQSTDGRAPPGPLASLGPPFEISQQAHPNVGIMSPVSQVNGHGSTLKEISSTSLDCTVPSKPKPKPKRVPKSKTVSDGAATVQPSVGDALNGKEASAPGKKKVVRSRKANQDAGAGAEQVDNGIVEPEAALHDDRSAHSREEEESPAIAAPKKNGKEKKGGQKKSKTGDSSVQTFNAADTSSSMPIIPSISPTALPTTSSPEAPPVDPKTKDSKSQGTSKSMDQPAESPRGSPASEKVENEKQTDKERKGAQGVNEAAVIGAPKGRKRKLGPGDGPADASTVAANKSKKRKPVGNDATTESSNDRDATSIAPPKSSKAKKRTKSTEEEGAQYDAHLDSVIMDVLAKRVSASSRQTPATAPVTTPASSESKKELSKELPIVGAEESTTVQPKRKKKPGKQKDTETSTASDGNTAGDNPPERKTSPDINGEKLKAVRESNNRLGSPQDITEPTGILQANRKTAVAVQRVAQETSQQHGNSISKQPKTSGIQSFAPSGSNISEMISRHEGESTSSDSDDSISGFSDNNEVAKEDTATASDPQKHRKGVSNLKVSPDTLEISATSFAIDGVASLDVDALLNPKSNLSWRDVLSTVQDDDHERQEQLMSDADEEEEEETEIRSPRNSLLRRRTPSPSYDEDDDNDGAPEDHQDLAPTEGPKMVSSRESSTISRDPEESADIRAGREEDDAHVISQLPSLKDVSTRGESVARGGSIDLIVQQAMEEDDTLYLTGLSQVPGKLRRPQKAHSERIDASGQDSVAEIDQHGVHDNAVQSSKESADKNSSPASAKTPEAVFKSSFRIHEARSTSESLRLLRGRIGRMRGRNVRVADAEQTSGPETSQNNPNLPFDDPDISQLVATSTPLDERRQHDALHRSMLIASDQSEGVNRADLSLSQPLARRDVTISSTTPKRTAGLGHKAKDASQVSSSRKENRETSKVTESSAEKTQDERSNSFQEGSRDRLGVEAPVDRDASSVRVRNGSTVQPTQSVDDYNKTKNKAITPPYTQLGRDCPSPEHRSSSDSSETEDSESEDEDLDQTSPPAAQAASTTQASHVSDRSLTNIAKRCDLFSRTSTPRPSFVVDASSQMGLQNDDGDNDSDQDDSSSSSSDSDRDSHIPEEKRAGHTASQSKPSRFFKTIFPFP